MLRSLTANVFHIFFTFRAIVCAHISGEVENLAMNYYEYMENFCSRLRLNLKRLTVLIELSKLNCHIFISHRVM